MVGRLVSFWGGLFSGAMLNVWGVSSFFFPCFFSIVCKNWHWDACQKKIGTDPGVIQQCQTTSSAAGRAAPGFTSIGLCCQNICHKGMHTLVNLHSNENGPVDYVFPVENRHIPLLC